MQISDWMNEIAANCDYAETEVIGQSFEGQDLTVMKLCKGGCGSKPAVWLDGGTLFVKNCRKVLKPYCEIRRAEKT